MFLNFTLLFLFISLKPNTDRVFNVATDAHVEVVLVLWYSNQLVRIKTTYFKFSLPNLHFTFMKSGRRSSCLSLFNVALTQLTVIPASAIHLSPCPSPYLPSLQFWKRFVSLKHFKQRSCVRLSRSVWLCIDLIFVTAPTTSQSCESNIIVRSK